MDLDDKAGRKKPQKRIRRMPANIGPAPNDPSAVAEETRTRVGPRPAIPAAFPQTSATAIRRHRWRRRLAASVTIIAAIAAVLVVAAVAVMLGTS